MVGEEVSADTVSLPPPTLDEIPPHAKAKGQLNSAESFGVESKEEVAIKRELAAMQASDPISPPLVI
jgi:hypothetical protein